MPIPQNPKTPRVPELVAATNAPFSLTSATANISLAVREPTGPGRAVVAEIADLMPRSVFLNVENMTSEESSGPYDVYLNLPPNDPPEKHPELHAGTLPMFGLFEASRADDKHPPNGLFAQLNITNLYGALTASPEWDPGNLRVSFVPRYPNGPKVRVGRVSVYYA
jgi:hypothetical protein